MIAPYDEAETRTSAKREAALMAALRDSVEAARRASHYARTLAGVDANALQTRADLAALPILEKSDLPDLQAADPPFGGLVPPEASAPHRLFLSPGPIAEPQMEAGDAWRMARALHAAGFTADDRVLNAFSYHVTPAGFMFDGAARALGCAVYPGGVGQTEMQADAVRRLGLTAYVGTPDFLKLVMEKAEADGAPITSIDKALVTGGPLFPSLRDWYAACGVTVRQCYGTAELGLVAYEVEGIEGMVLDEDVIVEIVRPGTGTPVPDGEVGEVVVTTFSHAYPLIRLATGDLSALMPPADGLRTNARLKGWMGRADQTAKVRGMFVRPAQVAAALARVEGAGRGRLEITENGGHDVARLRVETEDAALAEPLADAVRTECRVRATVEIVPPGSLPNDGLVIEDKRPVG